MLFFYKAKENSYHPLCNSRSSKHFFEIKMKLSLRKTSLKQSFSFQKNHDSFNLITTVNLTKTNNKN